MTKSKNESTLAVQHTADELVGQLEEWNRQGARGVLAKLRRGLSDATRQDAWAVLGGRFGKRAIDNPVWETVAGCFGFHPVSWGTDGDDAMDGINNMGWSYRNIRLAEKEGAKKMADEKEPHTRFRRLLACDDRQEICEHVTHAVRLAKSKEVEVNYRQLFCDLSWWSGLVKVAWAKAYWDVSEDLPAGHPGYGEIGQPNPDIEPAPDSADDSDE